ncbi:MAG: chemoreceptor glutamine deamidase CheD [Burkholderiales bacterium]|nr:chemoreceptor glutamine deamidase CheD [Burkholderiales bacterium]
MEGVASNLYFDKSFDLDAAKLMPGEFFVTERDMVLVTTLGSCVAACIRDIRTGIGGMNHFMLPDGGDVSSPTGTSARYGTYAMEVVINELLKRGAKRHQLEAKVFGGGNVLASMTTINVGQRNADFVLKYLAVEDIPVRARDLLEEFPRKVYFFPRTGKVLVKRLRDLHNGTLITRESDYMQRINRPQPTGGGEIELFA